jgi:hypothetical protein
MVVVAVHARRLLLGILVVVHVHAALGVRFHRVAWQQFAKVLVGQPFMKILLRSARTI